jgi:hypothetical protein
MQSITQQWLINIQKKRKNLVEGRKNDVNASMAKFSVRDKIYFALCAN